MKRPLPYLGAAALFAGLLCGCSTTPPNGAVLSLYQDAMVAAARSPTRAKDKPAPAADRSTRAVAAWRGGSGDGAASRSTTNPL